MLDLNLVSKCFQQPVLGAMHLSIRQGQRLSLVGPSGCGKTTLLNIIAGLDTDFEGERRLSRGARIAYMFQEPRLLPWRTVQQNLAMVGANPDVIHSLLNEVGLDGFEAHYPRELSLGMARRAALARALAYNPDLLLLDEPLVSLDPPTAQQMRELLCRMLERRPELSLVLVSHDPKDAQVLETEIVPLTAPDCAALHPGYASL